MRLISVEVQGFRRFAERQQLNLDGRVIAIVGPNEAGKSSLLAALTRLNSDTPLEPGDRSRTRPVDDDWIVRGCWLVEETDREALKDIPGIESVRWYVLEREADNS